jgi:hypothetical protein
MPWPSRLNPKENMAMKRNPKHPKSAPKKEVPTIKKNDELGEDELNKATGGTGTTWRFDDESPKETVRVPRVNG